MTNGKTRVLGFLAAVAVGGVGSATAQVDAGKPGASSWTVGGLDAKNSRYQAGEKQISPATVGALTLRWSLQTSGDVTATPAVEGDFVYFPDSAGFLYKVNKTTGAVVWKYPVSNYTGIAGDSARATPAIAGDALILGNELRRGTVKAGAGSSQARIFLPDGSEYDRTGKLDFAESQVNPGTGTLALRVVMPNPGQKLLPGMVVRVVYTSGTRPNTILIPQKAVTKTPTGHIAWVVGAAWQLSMPKQHTSPADDPHEQV